ncbi:MAG: dipeptidase, partial [Planctomycetaceae bacterium]
MNRRGFLQSSMGATSLGVTLAATSTGTTDSQAAGPDFDPLSALTKNLNPKIQAAREVALNILKPSQQELEHGLT